MKKATQRMLKQAIRIINSIDYPIQAKKRIVTVSDGAKNVPAIELVAKPGENREFRAYLTAGGRILFENTRDHPGDGARGPTPAPPDGGRRLGRNRWRGSPRSG